MNPFLGMLMAVPFDWPPKGWALCNGQILAISQNQALFALLGTTFGGNGQTTFALPDLRGRVPIGVGQGSGLSNYTLGEQIGAESIMLTAEQGPSHTHSIMASSNTPTATDPAGNAFCQVAIYTQTQSPDTKMNQGAISNTGGQPHENRQPYLVINWVIALSGIFPSRN